MFEKSLNEAELVLSTQKEPFIGVRQLWEEVIGRSKTQEFEVASLPDFSAMLEGDKRFQIIAAQNKNQDEHEIPEDVELADESMENLGFLSEDRVRLRNAKITGPPAEEEEEEVGSIRRKAFVSHAGIAKEKNSIINDPSPKKSTGKNKRRIKSAGSKTAKRNKTVLHKKTKKRKRNKK